MAWQKFIEKIMNDFRLSSVEIEQRTGVSNVTISNLKTGKVIAPNQNTIKKLEEGLSIVIDNTDNDNLTYRKVDARNGKEEMDIAIYKYPLLSSVYAGISPGLLISENITEYVNMPYKKQENVFAVRVVGDSMNHTIAEGDIVLADMDKDVSDNDIVIARLKNGKQLIKRFRRLMSKQIMFYSENGNYDPVIVDETEIEALYCIVGTWREFK